MKNFIKTVTALTLVLSLVVVKGYSQGDVIINLASVDGIDLTPDNLFSFQVQSLLSHNTHAQFTGSIKFRNSDMRINYKFEYDIRPGINILPPGSVHAQFTYSSQALKELFEQYKKLPQGIYEYCVSVRTNYTGNESIPGDPVMECVYHKSEDVFLIQLIDPENDAKIYEYHPALSWTVNYPFVAGLQYRIRVAEIKEGQNTVAAITRNNPVYDERNLMQQSIIYPVYVKPLVKNQPYAWTVDAYYKGLLLGGAEPWKFTIIEDSLLVAVPSNQSYFDFAEHNGDTKIYAIDTLKLKCKSFLQGDTLSLSLADEEGKPVKFATKKYPLKSGVNYIDLAFPGNAALKHQKSYIMMMEDQKKKQYKVSFIYINPLFIKR